VDDLLFENLSPDITSSAGVGGDNMTCILIVFKKQFVGEPKQPADAEVVAEKEEPTEEKKETGGTGEQYDI